PRLTIEPATPTGWNAREYSWDPTLVVMQLVAPRVSVEVNYSRRSWGNLQTPINRALTPADFDTFTYRVPNDPLLGSNAGQTLTLYDVKNAKFNVLYNFRTYTDNFYCVLFHINDEVFLYIVTLTHITNT